MIHEPNTDREEVKELCASVRTAYQENETINCYYVTNEYFSDFDISSFKSAINEHISGAKDSALKFFTFDFENIKENIEVKQGMLPKAFREKEITLNFDRNLNIQELHTTVSVVKIKDFAAFVNQGGNLLFHSNIRNYLKNTKINKGIRSTLKDEPDKFWFYNNGVTIVCDSFEERRGSLLLKAPQIVNGCQTAKSLADKYKYKTPAEISSMNEEGYLLVKIIKTKTSAEETEKKELRDNITRFTNSQNAVRGMDFYALEGFQRDLQTRLKNYGYFYEIQRGSFIHLSKTDQLSFKGHADYEYLLANTKNSKKYVLPAKEVIQSFTAGIKQMPNVAYGRANDLTPLGDRWKDIMGDEEKKLDLEYFVFPYLVLKHAKDGLNYKTGAKDFRKNAAFLFVATYYLFINKLFNNINNTEYAKPEEIPVEQYIQLFANEAINKELLKTTNLILKQFFREHTIVTEVGDNLRGFIQNKLKKENRAMWDVLELKIDQMIVDLEEEDFYPEIRNVLQL